MREIKFRAWDKNSSRWTNYSIVDDLLRFYNKHTGCWMTDKNQERFKLMQYTGLKDKNGVEIYEGDIAKNIPTGSVGVVVWDIHSTGFMRKTKRKETSVFDYFTLYNSKNNMEVIGNIHENPEFISEE